MPAGTTPGVGWTCFLLLEVTSSFVFLRARDRALSKHVLRCLKMCPGHSRREAGGAASCVGIAN